MTNQTDALEWLDRHVVMPHDIKTIVYASLQPPAQPEVLAALEAFIAIDNERGIFDCLVNEAKSSSNQLHTAITIARVVIAKARQSQPPAADGGV